MRANAYKELDESLPEINAVLAEAGLPPLTPDQVAETKAQSPFPLDKAYLQEVQSRLQQSIANKVQAAVRSCFLEKSSDPFGLGHRLRQRHPRQFSAQFPSWRDALARAQVAVSVSVKLERIGNGVENL